MIRLNLLVEGHSEEVFVNRVLVPHLAARGVFGSVRMVTTSRGMGRAGRGGLVGYWNVRVDLIHWLRGDRRPDARFTTLFDWYRLPGDFPGVAMAAGLSDLSARVECLERELSRDLGDARLIPYLQLHEFEALILADATKLLTMFPDQQEAVEALTAVADGEGGPEAVNLDNPPSKRVQELIPRYNKKVAAAQVADAVGLQTMRRRCPRFHAYMSRLEALDEVQQCP